MRWTRTDRARTARGRPAQRLSMWMDLRLLGDVAEHVVRQAQQTVEALRLLSEHMFATVPRLESDRICVPGHG